MIAILADDLTSALDGAAPFAARGWRASVLLDATATLPADAQLLSFDLDTRVRDVAVAARRFQQAARRTRGAALLYKTVDSTLRGHLGAETHATLSAAGRSKALIAPAFPAAGRTTVDGCQRVHGEPVHLTAFALDPRTPVHTSRIDDLLPELDAGDYIVHDAGDDAALDALIAHHGLQPELLYVGSPGLGAALARALGPAPHAKPVAPRAADRVLLLIGSVHPANDVQLAALAQAGVPLLSMGPDTGARQHEIVAAALQQAYAQSRVVALVSPRTISGDPGFPLRLAEQAGRLARRHADLYDGLVVTGGDTARHVADALEASRLDLCGEVEPGVPYGVLCSPLRDIPFATKAGGFGSTDTLLRCVDRLRTPLCDPRENHASC